MPFSTLLQYTQETLMETMNTKWMQAILQALLVFAGSWCLDCHGQIRSFWGCSLEVPTWQTSCSRISLACASKDLAVSPKPSHSGCKGNKRWAMKYVWNQLPSNTPKENQACNNARHQQLLSLKQLRKKPVAFAKSRSVAYPG